MAEMDDSVVGRGLRAPPDDKASVVQPRPGGQAFRAGSSDGKTRAKALDYREKRQSSQAGEPGLAGGESHPTESSRYSILEDALAAVLSSDEECSIPEPHMRFIARADRLCKEVRKRLDAAQSVGRGFTSPSGWLRAPPSNNQILTTKNRARAAPRCPT